MNNLTVPDSSITFGFFVILKSATRVPFRSAPAKPTEYPTGLSIDDPESPSVCAKEANAFELKLLVLAAIIASPGVLSIL